MVRFSYAQEGQNMDTAVISVIVAVAALIVSVIFGTLNANRQHNGMIQQQIDDAKNKAAADARIETSLTQIKTDTGEIRSEQKGIRNDMNDFNKRLVIVEESTKSAHHRIDRVDEELNIKHQKEGENHD